MNSQRGHHQQQQQQQQEDDDMTTTTVCCGCRPSSRRKYKKNEQWTSISLRRRRSHLEKYFDAEMSPQSSGDNNNSPFADHQSDWFSTTSSVDSQYFFDAVETPLAEDEYPIVFTATNPPPRLKVSMTDPSSMLRTTTQQLREEEEELSSQEESGRRSPRIEGLKQYKRKQEEQFYNLKKNGGLEKASPPPQSSSGINKSSSKAESSTKSRFTSFLGRVGSRTSGGTGTTADTNDSDHSRSSTESGPGRYGAKPLTAEKMAAAVAAGDASISMHPNHSRLAKPIESHLRRSVRFEKMSRRPTVEYKNSLQRPRVATPLNGFPGGLTSEELEECVSALRYKIFCFTPTE